jgi:hypothetical protein
LVDVVVALARARIVPHAPRPERERSRTQVATISNRSTRRLKETTTFPSDEDRKSKIEERKREMKGEGER